MPIPDLLMHPVLLSLTNFDITLQATQLNESGVEFPVDDVRIDVGVNNLNGGALSQGTWFSLAIYKNDHLLRSVTFDSGSSWSYTLTDVFTHGVHTVYKVAITTAPGIFVMESPVSITIDEAKLHELGIADLGASIFSVEKHWHQNGINFEPYYSLRAAVDNHGIGYAQTDSVLTFFSDGATIATLPIPAGSLPGPGDRVVPAIGLRGDDIPSGRYLIRAKIDPVINEVHKEDNISTNAGEINNTPAAAAGEILTLILDFHSSAENLTIEIANHNNQVQSYHDIRLLLLKNEALVKEWKPLSFGPRASSRVNYEEPIILPNYLEMTKYKALLTSDPSAAVVEESNILDIKEATLLTINYNNEMLTDSLRTEIPAKFYAYDSSMRVKEEDVVAMVDRSGVRIIVKGKKIISGWFDAWFTFVLLWHPTVINGAIRGEIEVINVEINQGWTEPLWLLFFGGAYVIVEDIIEGTVKRKIESMITSSLPTVGVGNIIAAVPQEGGVAIVVKL
jgi:hypothetical protein